MKQGRTEQRGACANQGSRDIVCPFFRSHNATEINCEGYHDDVVCAMKYRTTGSKKQQQLIYCQENYKYCEHYNALMLLKYNEEEDE